MWVALLLLLLFPLSVQSEDLGELSANPFNPASTSNPFGAGSPFQPDGINNQFSSYGSPFSNQSATNPFATDAPRLYDQQGNDRGKVSMNPYDPDSVSTTAAPGVPIHQSGSIICTAREIPIDRTAPPIRMAQAGASKGDSSPVWG